jgi:16S rRNA (guanine966-N2)-methyltransferase
MRVIAGSAKGHTLWVPKVPGLRPTSDRARESLFNVLTPGMDGARVLDVFAGSGALGIEALSRGAAEATFVERSRRACEVIADNLERCGFSDSATIIQAEWRTALRRLGSGEARFDLALFDPPYDWEQADLCLSALAEHSLLAADGLAVIEQRASTELVIPEGWSRDRVLKVGDSAFSLCLLAKAVFETE